MISKKINIGIIQGRLTKTQKNILQKFPTNWAEEFYTASKLGYKYIYPSHLCEHIHWNV